MLNVIFRSFLTPSFMSSSSLVLSYNMCLDGLLQVATNSRVYLFDIFLLGSRAFNNGLQMVLEDKRILKVSVSADSSASKSNNKVLITLSSDFLRLFMIVVGFLIASLISMEFC